MDELRLLARSVFVLNENNKVVYKEIVSEGTNYPDFEAALKHIEIFSHIELLTVKVLVSILVRVVN